MLARPVKDHTERREHATVDWASMRQTAEDAKIADAVYAIGAAEDNANDMIDREGIAVNFYDAAHDSLISYLSDNRVSCGAAAFFRSNGVSW